MNADTGTKVLLSDVRDLEHKYVEIAVIVIPDCIISCYRAVSDLAKQWLLAITGVEDHVSFAIIFTIRAPPHCPVVVSASAMD